MKRAKTNPNNLKLQNDPKRPKFQNWENLEFFSNFRFSNVEPNSQIWAFCAKKYQLSNLEKFCRHHIFKVLISDL